MIKGVILSNRPLLTLTIGGLYYGVQDIVTLVDTGFTGELKIPPEKVPELGLQITHTQPVKLGDESTVNMNAAIAYVEMEGVVHPVSALIYSGIPVIGVGLMKKFGYTLTMDFPYNIFQLERK